MCTGEVGALGEPEPAAAGWCSRWCRVARASAGRRSRPAAERELDPGVVGQLGAAVPGDRPAQVLGQVAASRAIIASATLSASWRPGRCSRIVNRVDALHQGADRGLVRGPHDQVAFPVPGHGPVGDLGGALADRERLLVGAERVALGRVAGPRCRPFQAELPVQVRPQRRRGSARTAPGRSSRGSPDPCSPVRMVRRRAPGRSASGTSPGPSTPRSADTEPGFSTSLNALGRRRRSCAARCATGAQYDPSGPLLRVTSRQTTDLSRPIRSPICGIGQPAPNPGRDHRAVLAGQPPTQRPRPRTRRLPNIRRR